MGHMAPSEGHMLSVELGASAVVVVDQIDDLEPAMIHDDDTVVDLWTSFLQVQHCWVEMTGFVLHHCCNTCFSTVPIALSFPGTQVLEALKQTHWSDSILNPLKL